jgi:uncharacterized alkaline shock family protein YloU
MAVNVVVDISPAAYADIARRAAREVEGVMGTARDPFFGIFGKFRRGYRAGGVKVESDREGVRLSVDVVLKHGCDIRKTLAAAREKITDRVKELTDTSVKVDIALKAIA